MFAYGNKNYYMKDRQGVYYTSEYPSYTTAVFQTSVPRAGDESAVVMDEWQSRSAAAATAPVKIAIYRRDLLKTDEQNAVYVRLDGRNKHMVCDGQWLLLRDIGVGYRVTVTLPPPTGAWIQVRRIQDDNNAVTRCVL